MKVTVKGTWMQACGFPAVDTEMEVLAVLGKMPNGRDRMYKVLRPHDGQEWIVSDWRLVTVPYVDGRETRSNAIYHAQQAYRLMQMTGRKVAGFHLLPDNSAWFAVHSEAVYIFETDEWCVLLKSNGALAKACRSD